MIKRKDVHKLTEKELEARIQKEYQKQDRIKQAEGLCHMQYQCKKCGKIESIWNSRPRVTPFGISCSQCDGTMNHANWNLDRYDPNYIPKKGERIFVDFSREALEKFRKEYIEKYWDDEKFPMKERTDLWNSKEEALQYFLDEWEFGQPTIEKI